jgi:hypothetical protein
MAIPTHYIKKRDILHSEKSSAATLIQIGREFLAGERFSDALDFFEKAKDKEGIAEIKKIALARGDTFLLARLDRFDRELVSTSEWENAARKAAETGRETMAAFAARKLAPPPVVAAKGAPSEKTTELPGEAPLAEV